MTKRRSICIAISVDIDRWPDEHIRKHYLRQFREVFGCATPRDVRQQCQLARLKGYEVFPPCDNVNEKGRCQGHPVDEHCEEGHAP